MQQLETLFSPVPPCPFPPSLLFASKAICMKDTWKVLARQTASLLYLLPTAVWKSSWNKGIALSTLALSALVLFILSPCVFSRYRAKSTRLKIQTYTKASDGNFSYLNTKGLQKLDCDLQLLPCRPVNSHHQISGWGDRVVNNPLL